METYQITNSQYTSDDQVYMNDTYGKWESGIEDWANQDSGLIELRNVVSCFLCGIPLRKQTIGVRTLCMGIQTTLELFCVDFLFFEGFYCRCDRNCRMFVYVNQCDKIW